MIFSLLLGVGVACTVTSLLMSRISRERFQTQQDAFKALRKEAVHGVSIYRFDGTSGAIVHNHNYESFRLAHLKTFSDPTQIDECVSPIKAAHRHDWNHYGGGTPVFLLFVTSSGPKSFFGETIEQFPNDLWIATDSGNEGVLALGLGKWLEDNELLSQLRLHATN